MILKREELWPGISDDLVSNFLNFWYPRQMPVFLVGFMVFFAIRDIKGVMPIWSLRVLLAGSLLMMVGLAFIQSPIRLLGQTISIYVSYGLCFGLLAFCLAEGAANWIVNAPIRYLGKISFSTYLLHFAVLDSLEWFASVGIKPLDAMDSNRGLLFWLEFFIFLVLVTVALSTVTYNLVERPTISFGNGFLKKFSRRRPAPL